MFFFCLLCLLLYLYTTRCTYTTHNTQHTYIHTHTEKEIIMKSSYSYSFRIKENKLSLCNNIKATLEVEGISQKISVLFSRLGRALEESSMLEEIRVTPQTAEYITTTVHRFQSIYRSQLIWLMVEVEA